MEKKYCECGCGQVISPNRRFVSGHNLRVLKRTQEWHKNIAEGQRKAWATIRKKVPVGSTNIHHEGYVMAKVANGVWRGQHLIIMESIIGRPLGEKEIVHHIDGDRASNAPENLYLCSNKSHHNIVHRSFSKLLPKLLNSGAVIFNHEKGLYELGKILRP